MPSEFVTTSASPGWKLGKWSQLSPTTWQEQKLDNPKEVYQFQVVNGPSVPGSTTVRLKMQNSNTEILLLESTVQVFSNAGYLGEYCGKWNGGAPPAAGRSKASKPPAEAPTQKPGPAAQPARQAAPAAVPASRTGSLETTMTPAAAQQKSVPAAVEGRIGMRQAAGAPGSAVAVAAPAFGAVDDGRPKKAQGLDKAPDKVQKLCDAAKNGDVQGVNQLLASGIDPDGPARDGRTPLMAAAGGGHLKVVEALLATCADPNLGKGDETPLTIAFQKGKQDILKALFGASFSNLDNTIQGSGPGDISYAPTGGYGAVPENAADELRGMTSRLAGMNKKDTSPSRDASPQRSKYGNYADKMSGVNTAESEDSDAMRMQNVRLTMRSIGSRTRG